MWICFFPDASRFYRVQFVPPSLEQPVILWINVENKYPISKDESDQLYAVLPENTIQPPNGFSPSVRIAKHSDLNVAIIIQLHNSVYS